METIILFIKTTTKGSKSLLQVAKTRDVHVENAMWSPPKGSSDCCYT